MNDMGTGQAGTGGTVSGGLAADLNLQAQISNGRRTSPFGIITRTPKAPTRKEAVRKQLQLWVDESQAQLQAQGVSEESYILKQIAYKRKVQKEHAERVAASSIH